jgi:hypothetical protein
MLADTLCLMEATMGYVAPEITVYLFSRNRYSSMGNQHSIVTPMKTKNETKWRVLVPTSGPKQSDLSEQVDTTKTMSIAQSRMNSQELTKEVEWLTIFHTTTRFLTIPQISNQNVDISISPTAPVKCSLSHFGEISLDE